MLLFPGHRGLNGQQLHVDVGHVHGGALHGQPAHPGGVHPHPVDEAGHLHAGVHGQILDEMAGIQHVSADFVGVPGHHRLHDVGGVLVGPLVGDAALLPQLVPLFGPARDLVHAPPGVLVQGDVEPVDELRVLGLDVEHVVLGVVLAGLGAVVAELVNVVEAHHVVVLLRGVLLLGPPAHLGVKVVAFPVVELQQPPHVVDARDQLFPALQLVLHPQGL